MPMAPAIRPARSCSAPSSVEIDCAVAWVKLSGSAPYLSWLASSVAVSWSKLPEISVPPEIAQLIVGAEMTRPSRVMATGLPMLAAVNSAQAAEPVVVEVELDDPLAGAWRVPALASVTSVPSTTGGPEQVLDACRPRCRPRRSPRAGRPRRRLAVAGERGVRRRRLLLGDRRARPGRPAASAGRRRAGRRRGGRPAARRRRSAPRRRRSGAAASVGVGGAVGGGVALSVGRRLAGSGPGMHRAEPQLRGLPQLTGLVAVVPGNGDDDVRVALGDHLGLGDTEAVDPLLDDLAGQLQVLLGRAPCRRACARSA